jgi:hypothetical protein
VTSIAAARNGKGYWLLAADGGVFSFGVTFHGSLPGRGIDAFATQIKPTSNGGGYYILAADGRVFGLGNTKSTSSTAYVPSSFTVDMHFGS